MRGPVAVAAVAASVRGATARDPVVVCTFSGNESHAGAFVAHHLAVGAAHVYAVVDVSAGPATRDAFRAFQSATTVLDSTKPGIAGEHRAHADCVKRVVRDLAAKEPWFGGAKHAWIAQIDVDEYVLPVDPWSDLGETLERYGRAREWSLVLQRPWFGGGHAEAEVACAAAPPTFRFMRYGTAASALASRLGKPVVSTRALPKDLAAAWGPHRVPGLTRPDIFADVAGDRGLVLPHLKPQSFAEFSAKFQWNGFARNKYDASRATYDALVAATTGATDARLLLRAPRVCARLPAAARRAVDACGLAALCDDCRALRRRARCPAGGSRRPGHDALAAGVEWRERGVAVVGARAADVARKIRAGWRAAAPGAPPRLRVDGNGSGAVVYADDGHGDVCHLDCARTLAVDATRVSDVLASLVAAWLGPTRRRFVRAFPVERTRRGRGRRRRPAPRGRAGGPARRADGQQGPLNAPGGA